MARTQYCWRCRVEVPMLDEREWAEVAPGLENAIAQIKLYRARHGCSLQEAKRYGYGREALERYHAITGYREENPDALWHHRLSVFGPPCATCGKPLRTPRAKFCAACGALAKDGPHSLSP